MAAFPAFAIFSLTVLPRLMSEGMFLDGVTYASIARNLAEGKGSFWQLHYTNFVYPVFFEHPPLHFLFQAQAFRLFGNSFLIESFYSAFLGLCILFMTLVLATQENFIIRAKENYSNSFFSPVFFAGLALILMPISSWIMANNMLELSVSLFSLLSAFMAIYTSRLAWLNPIFKTISGVFLFFSCLSKGPVGSFPLVIPFLIFIFSHERKLRELFVSYAMMTLGLLFFPVVFILTSPEFLTFSEKYLFQQVLQSVTGQRETANSRFVAPITVLEEIILPIFVILIITFFVLRKRNFPMRLFLSRFNDRVFLFWLSVGLLSSLPIMVSPKQSRFYVFPALPFFALAIARFMNFKQFSEIFHEKYEKSKKVLTGLCTILIIIAIISMILVKNEPKREIELHKYFGATQDLKLDQSVISVYPPELATSWTLVAYLQRYHRLSLTHKPDNKFMLVNQVGKAYIEKLGNFKLHYPNSPESQYFIYVNTLVQAKR